MNHLPGKFVWFEHVSDDIPKAVEFYRAWLGWRIDAMPMGPQTYHMIQVGAEGIGGFRTATPGMPNHWISYLSVADVDASAAAAQAAGATVLMPPTDFDQVGRGAALADPTGAVFCIWKSAMGDRPDRQPVPPGDWYWNECCTHDDAPALAFYERAFGFGHESTEMAPGFTYHVLMKDGVPRGGLMKLDQPGAHPGWLPYVSVADCDATAARAAELGAQVLVAPKDIPDVGRFTVVMDPQGAVIGAIRGTATG